MHADIAIAPRLPKIIAAIRAIRVILKIIFPRRDFAKGAQIHPVKAQQFACIRASLLEFGRLSRHVLPSTPRESQAMEPVQHLTRSHRWEATAAAILLATCAGGTAAGCFTDKRPTEVLVTPVASALHPAKPPDCDMPVLTQEPTASYQQVAIVEAWADVDEDPAKVMPELKRQACATGAQALLIVTGKKQDIKSMLYGVTPNESETQVSSENRTQNGAGEYINKMQYKPKVGEAGHTGYYIDALAIDFTAGANTAATRQSP